MNRICYIFPGQGAQYVGMGKDLYETFPESKSVFDEAQKVLPDIDIKRLCFQGPIEELTETANSQVCILVASIAASKILNTRVKGEGWRVEAGAGLSLGELTALVVAGSVEFQDAVRLVRRRGELMEEASNKNPGSMASIIGLSLKDTELLCKETGAEIANLNCPGQIVISGTKESIQKAIEFSTNRGAKKAIPLNVSGPFHSSLMKEAADLFGRELEKVNFSSPDIPIVSNVTADFEKSPQEIKQNLIKQLYSPVRWEESVIKISKSGIDTFFEIGPGKVLKGLLRRINPALNVLNIEKPEDLVSLNNG